MSRQNSARADGKKVSSELFTLTYGALVSQLVKDFENDDAVNKKLYDMGYNIGVRLIEDLIAKGNVQRCHDLRETADIIAKLGFRMFLGVTPIVSKWSPGGDEFSLMLDNNPLAEFVELPSGHDKLCYSNILCGVLKGALEMVQMDVEVHFVQDVLHGDDTSEIRVKFIKKLEDAIPAGEE